MIFAFTLCIDVYEFPGRHRSTSFSAPNCSRGEAVSAK